MTIVRSKFFLICTVAFSIFAIIALFHPGFFPIHDDEQISRLFELNYDLLSGHIPPRLSQNLGFGYDYPFFNFYPPFVYYFAEIFKIIGFSYILSTKIMIAAGFILSAVFMYLFTKEYFGKFGGLLSAVLYVYAPYHSVDVYVRGAFPEFWTFVFIPAIFWALLRLTKKTSVLSILIFGLLFAGLVLTHNLIAMTSAPFILIYVLYLIYKSKEKRNLVFGVFIGFLLAALLSAFFSLPAILENKYTMVSLLTQQLADYNLHFVSVKQFFNSPWGYGGSILGPNDGFSLEVGKIHLVLLAVSVLIFVYELLRKKVKNLILVPFALIFLLSLFLQSYYSKFIWDNVAALSYIQFPWRFMIFSVFSSSFIAGYVVTLRHKPYINAFITLFLVLVIVLFYGSLFRPSKYLVNVNDDDYVSQDIIRWKISSMAFEYVPKGIATKQSSLGTTLVDITQDEVAKETATALSSGMMLEVIEDKPHYKKVRAFSLSSGKLQLNTFSFPGWKVFINGRQVRYNDTNKFRLITIDVPKGHAIIEVKFTNTSVRNLGNLLSIIGILVFVLLLPFYRRKIEL